MAKLIYIPPYDLAKGGAAYLPSIKRLGVQLSPLPNKESYVLPLHDKTALKLADHPNFMSKETLDTLLNRDRLHLTGIESIPTTILGSDQETPQDCFIKPRNSATNEGIVCQPNLGSPIEDYDISFSVDGSGKILPFLCLKLLHTKPKQIARVTMMTKEELANILPQIQAAVEKLGIKNSMHNVQFLPYNSKWLLSDWNPRPIFAISEGVLDNYNILDAPLAHMLDLPPVPVLDVVYESRGFYETPIKASLATAIRAIGLVPRTRGSLEFYRVNGIASTQEELDQKYQQLEQLIAQ